MKTRAALFLASAIAIVTALLAAPANADSTTPNPASSPTSTPDPIYTTNDTFWGN
ncbi:hypothetical protein GCM10009759_54980 [Kitasatospora saccharophila]|uniref:Uncharacterized protein n=1 Tax=Kitasatospora saccharophila TaxID=407973 RepID=A0ABN2XI94_9ACTN